LIYDKNIRTALYNLKKLMNPHGVTVAVNNQKITFQTGTLSFKFNIASAEYDFTATPEISVISEDYLFTVPEKIAGIILSKLNLNAKIFARNCEVKKIDRQIAESFLNNWHLLGATQSGFNRGLFYKDELMAVSSFSKGRKMDRLPEDERSFELIRFCCKPGITVTGGLTKLVKNFFVEKKAGDIMTYVDKQMSDGRSFLSAGFKKHSETETNYFLIHRKTFARTIIKDPTEKFDNKTFYKTRNFGSIKMIFTLREKL